MFDYLISAFLFCLKDLDIAIVKATNHVECPPKERHVRSQFSLFQTPDCCIFYSGFGVGVRDVNLFSILIYLLAFPIRSLNGEIWFENAYLVSLLVEIFSATSVMRPRADVAYCIHALAKRLSKTRSWIVKFSTIFHFNCIFPLMRCMFFFF